ncbi:MAG TPA: glycerophosphodiester phosphodiesterase [Gemmatimonadaceae bacterium]|nr:glycerophosphodiester phosphodiesterase [Gemmatimonadaceae bacterium]
MSPSASPRLVGHRGAPREAPENTLSSFERALARGADAIELDVHATADGVVVVHHDPVPRAHTPEGDPARTPIASMTLDALRRLTVGTTDRIPTLAEVLELVGRRATVYVEIKGAAIEEAVAEAIERGPAECAVHSFDHRAIGRMREIAPHIPRGLLFDVGTAPDFSGMARRYEARDLWPHWSLIDERMVRDARTAGSRIIAWTVNDEAVALRLARLGVDALCTDDVPLIRARLAAGVATG